MSDYRKGFGAALLADRYNRTTRLVYADWLDEQGEHDAATEQRRRATPEWEAADRWMHEFAASLGWTGGEGEAEEDYGPYREITYDDVIRAGRDYAKDGDCFVQMGSEKARSVMYDADTRKLFWQNWQIVTGETVDDDTADGAVFSCSC